MILSVLIHFGTFMIALALKFENITYDIFPMNSGIVAAFGHFNTDEYTDVFSLQQGGNKLQLFMGSESGQQFQPHVNCTFGSVITSVVPGDFNGDSDMDILITLTTESDSTLDVKVLWGNDQNLDCKSSTLFNIVNQPLVVDFNGDMIPDIIGETKDGDRYVWFYSSKNDFTKQKLHSEQKFANPHSSGLIDVNNDLAADILIMGEDNIEVWINNGTGFTKNSSILYPSTNSDHTLLQSTFIDLNLDAEIDLILPVCNNPNCDNSTIKVFNKISKKWEVLFDNFKYQNVTWGFKLPKGPKSPLDMAALPVTLRAGDVDMDGYPDFITVLQSKPANTKSRPVIIKNSSCVNCSHCVLDRCLEIIWDIPGLQEIPNIEIATFFDIYEDGILDILASSSSKEHEWKIHALKNSEVLDSCFMKVLVLSGVCKNCTLGHVPYGVNQPGPLVRYNMTKQDGHPLVGSMVQMPQSAYFALHLPYSVFGLGQTPNFIDSLTVAIPAKFNKSVHKREWIQIIPNSQIVIIPNPPQDEEKWVRKLFVTPSHYVFLTCIALIGTCMFIAIIVGLLHWRERKEDKKEKMQDAYRFHFDAM